jgi:O-succinylhomoserine sulfhydrylase
MKFETQAIRTQVERSNQREHSVPIFATSGYVFESTEQMRSLFAGEQEGNIYSRYTNPNCAEFEEKMALLEGYEYAISTSTGMAALFAVVMGLLKQGDHLLCTKAVFGSSFQLAKDYFPKYGIETSFLLSKDIENIENFIQSNTKMILLETPSNPGLELFDLEAIAQIGKKYNLITAVDNCFATPYLQRPKEFGIDISFHSATKFIDGQGRVMGGVILMDKPHYESIRGFTRNSGPTLSPFNAWILSKSLETLVVRMDRHCLNAMELANYFSVHKEVEWVKYPFLPSHPQYEIAKKQMKQGGGLVTVEFKGGFERAEKFINNLKLLTVVANLGDTRTIVTHPASSTHFKMPEEDRLSVGITNGTVRISVGLEHLEDIISDIEQALVLSK